MRITALAENTAKDSRLAAQHGLSLFVETDEIKFLFDMGQGDLFCRNAEVLGIDLAEASFAVLSHGHYDHGGGLPDFFRVNPTAPVYLSPYAFEPHFNAEGKDIGLDPALEKNERLLFVRETQEIFPGITLYPALKNPLLYPKGGAGMTTVREGKAVPEDFRHEIYLQVAEKEKRILFSGCSHRGILNIATEFSPDVLIGGFHFSKLPLDDTLKNAARRLAGADTDYYTCHCTGEEQIAFMKPHLPRLFSLSTGDEIVL